MICLKNYSVAIGLVDIHSKSGISRMDKSADDLEFSAGGLSGNAKTFKFALLEEPALQFVTIYVEVLLKSQKKTYTHCIFSLKMPSDTKFSGFG